MTCIGEDQSRPTVDPEKETVLRNESRRAARLFFVVVVVVIAIVVGVGDLVAPDPALAVGFFGLSIGRHRETRRLQLTTE